MMTTQEQKPLEWSEFERVEMHAGTIVEARPFPEARKPAIQLLIDFGPLGMRRSSAQITALYTPETLPGQQVIAVLNFPPKRIGPFVSECLVLGTVDAAGVVTLLQPERKVENGLRIA